MALRSASVSWESPSAVRTVASLAPTPLSVAILFLPGAGFGTLARPPPPRRRTVARLRCRAAARMIAEGKTTRRRFWHSMQVFFLFWLGSDVKEERSPAGFFDCPRCRERRPCDRLHVTRRTKLYSVVPIWTATIADLRVCQVCGTREGHSAPGPAAGDRWRCPGCGNVNPGQTDACLDCGVSR